MNIYLQTNFCLRTIPYPGLDADLRIRHPAIRADPDELIGDGDLVQVALLAVDDESVRNPDLRHEGPVESQLGHAWQDSENCNRGCYS